ncbi:MAG: hypothetical protein K6G00_12825 [Treponema sp.]|nr:hypothetical protein [Treponema sp.]
MKKVLLAIIMLAYFSLLSAQEFSPSGGIKCIAGAGMPQTHDNAGEFLTGTSTLYGSLKIFGANSSAYIDGSLCYDALKAQTSSGRFDFVSNDNSFHLKIKETWMDYDGGLWALRIGRQINAWGKADGLQVTDVLCPKDGTSLIASDYSDSRIGIDAVRFSIKTNTLNCDAYWIPFFTPSVLPLAKENPLKKIMIPQNINTGRFSIPVAEVTKENFELPETTLNHGEGAIRIGAYLPFADFSLYGFYGYDRDPLLSYSIETDSSGIPKNLSIHGSYKKMAMIGADAAIPVKAIVLRLEAAFFPEKYFSTKPEEQFSGKDKAIQKNQLVALAGFDWMPSGWTITAQYYMNYLFGELDKIERKSYQHTVSLSISKSVLQENLKLSASGLLGLNDFDSMISCSAAYSLSDQMTITLGGDFFVPGPEEKGNYGKYEDLSCAYLKAEFKF